jgi:amino acid adenylation domain-containing protein
VAIARLTDDETVVQLVAHHIAADGYSFEVFAEDLAEFYAARRTGRRPVLPPAPSIVDRAMHLASGEENDDAALAWWGEQFAGGVPELELPLRQGYGVKPSYDAAACDLPLDMETVNRLRKLAGGCNATLSSTLLAGFHALLYRISGQERFVHAFPVAGQMDGADQALVGHCVNFLPLIAEVDPGQSFKELVGRSSNRQLDALENGKVTYGRLLRDLKLGRDGGRRPLCEIIFNLQSSGDPGDFGGLDARAETVDPHYSNSTLFLNPTLEPDRLLLTLKYNRNLLDEATVRGWLETYRNLLLDAASDPAVAVGDLALIDEEGRRDLADWSGTGELTERRSVGELFVETCGLHAERTALSWQGGSWSYAKLGERAAGYAAALRDAGVSPGERVGVSLPRSADLIAALLGVLEAGACYVPMEPEFPETRRREILEDAGVRVLIAADGSLPGMELAVICPDAVGTAEPQVIARGPDDPAYVMYTSGSTGKPKGVVVPHRGIVRLVKGADYCEFGPDEVIVQASTAAFDAATYEIYGSLLNGGRLVLLEKGSTLDEIATVVREEGVTAMFLTSGLFELMVDERLDDLQGVRQLLTGGEAFSLSHMRRAFEGLPNTRLIHAYGPTENTTFTTCHLVRKKDIDSGIIPIGGPIAGTTVRIVDEQGREVPAGVPGELQCGGPGLALGYLGRSELTEEKFIENGSWYRTGDVCRWSEEGLVEFVGRVDEQVKLRGFRIEPGEVETTLAKHPAVQRCKVAVRGSGAGGKRMLAWYSPVEGASGGVGAIRTWLATQLPAFMQPDAIVSVDQFPLNRNGKVDVSALPEPHSAGRSESKAPAGPVEEKLATIWRDILKVDEIGRDDEFFDLGGNSLGGLQLFSRIHREFDVSLPLATLLQARSISALAQAVEAGANGAGLSMASPAPVRKVSSLQESWLATVRDGGDLPPVFGIHGGDGGILFYRELADRMPTDRPFMAIESPELSNNDEIVVASVEDTASRYVEMVRDFRPEGPYLLAGYSFGGVVAYEMARQLVEAGAEVPYLVLLDTENPAIDRKQYSLVERLSVFWNSNNDLPLLKRFKRLAGRIRGGVETNLRVKAEIAEAQRSEAAEAHSELRSIQLREAHYRAMLDYQPKPYPGALTLFRADTVNDKFETPPDYGWSSLVGEIRIVDIPGEHLTIFSEENVESLARKFAARMPAEQAARRALAGASGP